MSYMDRIEKIRNNRYITHIIRCLVIMIVALTQGVTARALPVSHYADHSVLSQGRWVRVEVPKTGLMHISSAQLRAMGFGDTSKVNVYGTGGGQLSEGLSEDNADDLPRLTVARPNGGILFFANDIFTWQPKSVSSEVPYSHTINGYAQKAYYFLSDADTGRPEPTGYKAPAISGQEIIDTFTARMVHEQDLESPAETGRMVLGEDFRTTSSRNFSFDMPDNVDGTATMRVVFGAATTGGGQLMFNVKGVTLPTTYSDRVPALIAEQFISVASTVKEITGIDDKLDLNMTFTYSGQVTTARLDYIEMFYPRKLKLHNGQLHFYLNNTTAKTAQIEGCTATTLLWDITDPASPRPVEYTLQQGKLQFTTPTGYSEYVAFEPSQVSAAASTSWQVVSNQDIHGMETPDMVIITLDAYKEGAEKLAKLHRDVDGMIVHVLTPDVIYNEFSGGTADVTAFRRMLKMWYDRGGERTLGYCLLMGRPSYDNKLLTHGSKKSGYTPLPIWQSLGGTSETTSYSTDAYIAMLEDVAPGFFNMRSAKQSVAVGRLPVKSSQEALEMASKIEKYVKQPSYGAWRNRIMMIADDRDRGIHLEQTETMYSLMSAAGKGDGFTYDRIYLDAFPREYTSVGLTFPTAKTRMMRNWNEGVMLTTYIGHASPTSWTHEKLMEWSDMISFTNQNLTFLYAATCSFGKWDANAVSGAEMMVLNPRAGAIGMIVPSRTVYMHNNGELTKRMAAYMLTPEPDGRAPRVGDIYRKAMNEYVDENKLRFCMMGDPAMRLPRPEGMVRFETIDGSEVDGELLHEVPALGTVGVTGSVVDYKGNLLTDFNGKVALDLYDAETVVVTEEREADSVEKIYNDRKSKLASTVVKVSGGRWQATLRLPAEISNNYSPAMIAGYAWSEQGAEANGRTENLYVYGYADNDVQDSEGPAIESLYLNTPSFADGDLVNSNPLLFARVYDALGINVSDSGIGHQMSLTIDGNKTLNDVNIYFAHDSEREGAGTITYPLSDIAPGEHTLALTVWDNANNSSTSELRFNVGAAMDPVITNLATNVNPAVADVTFSVTIDRPNTEVNCLLEVFDLSGSRVWSSEQNLTTDIQSNIQTTWDLTTGGGHRVPRGIYLYRATVTTAEGTYTSASRKLAVAGMK